MCINNLFRIESRRDNATSTGSMILQPKALFVTMLFLQRNFAPLSTTREVFNNRLKHESGIEKTDVYKYFNDRYASCLYSTTKQKHSFTPSNRIIRIRLSLVAVNNW